MTVALDVQFLAAARPGDFLVVRGRITRQTTSLAFLQGTLTVRDETIATASMIAKVL